MIEITLVYKNGSSWFAGSFNDEETANKWIDNERSKSGWDTSTLIQAVNKGSRQLPASDVSKDQQIKESGEILKAVNLSKMDESQLREVLQHLLIVLRFQ